MDRLDGQVGRVVVGVELHLPAVLAEHLAEETLAIEQANPGQCQATVAGRLEMVASQHAESAGVDRQAFGEPELGREVGHPGLAHLSDRQQAAGRRG